MVAALLVLGVSVTALSEDGSGSEGDRIVFASTRDGGMEIYVLNPDDGSAIRLTHNDGFDGLPDWSPDGSRIAFTSDMDGFLGEQEPGGPSNLELYTMASDGSAVVRLTRNSRYDGESDWSPDGSKLAFDAADPFEDLQVYVMDSDALASPTALTSGAPNGHPSWSPDGSKIAFTSLRDGDREIYVMAADGSGQTNLTNSPGSDDNLATWSPDGSRIAFFSERDGNPEIYVMAADGSDPVRLTHSPADDVDPGWSPDGRSIVFTSGWKAETDLVVMAADGSGGRALTNNDALDLMPEWASSPSPAVPAASTAEELMILVERGSEQGVIEAEEQQMIGAVLELGQQRVHEVMVPRIDIQALPSTAPLDEIVDTIIREGHSRIPVYEESIDNVIGILYAKDLLPFLAKGETPDIRAILRAPLFVPESISVDDLLHSLQRRKVHIAIVLDEYGGTAGLVTIEDLLEEIVGEIQDEYDVEEPMIEVISEDEARIDGRASIDDLADHFAIELDDTDREQYDTVGGLVYHRIGGVPVVGDTVEVQRLTLTVESTDGRRVGKVLVVRRSANGSGADAEVS